MIKEFDGSRKMMEDIIYIDSKSFKDIDSDIDELCKRIKKNKQYELFIKYIQNIPVAYLGILYMCNLHYDGAWIDLIAVVEEHRNKGIGKELLKFAENKVKEKKGTVLTGLVRKDNVSSSTMFLNSNFKSSEKDFILYLKDI
ncbi:GNAT family N-acetyltransferase [Fusobacterium polymorphum]|uniref:GNAT family N-acetyltransferase n=1 Tax=Fusobacterium nucleatum subsp. polymorphum TaxID=76857 RepID=UPI003009142B